MLSFNEFMQNPHNISESSKKVPITKEEYDELFDKHSKNKGGKPSIHVYIEDSVVFDQYYSNSDVPVIEKDRKGNYFKYTKDKK